MIPALNGSSEIQHFEHANAIEICDKIMFVFCLGLPHIIIIVVSSTPPHLSLTPLYPLTPSQYGSSAKFPGSGGAVIGLCLDEDKKVGGADVGQNGGSRVGVAKHV